MKEVLLCVIFAHRCGIFVKLTRTVRTIGQTVGLAATVMYNQEAQLLQRDRAMLYFS